MSKNPLYKKVLAAWDKKKKLLALQDSAIEQLKLVTQQYLDSRASEVVESLKGLQWKKKAGNWRRRWIAPLPKDHLLLTLDAELCKMSHSNHPLLCFNTVLGGITVKFEATVEDYRSKLQVAVDADFLKIRLGLSLCVDAKADHAKVSKIIRENEITSDDLREALKLLDAAQAGL